MHCVCYRILELSIPKYFKEVIEVHGAEKAEMNLRVNVSFSGNCGKRHL